MANNPRTSKDRTEQEVLSAIEEALNLRDLDQAAPKRTGPASAPTPAVAASPGASGTIIPPPIAPATPVASPASATSASAQRARLPRVDEFDRSGTLRR